MALPSITSLNPDSVEQDWEGTVVIHGSNFDDGSYPFFSGASSNESPKKKYINSGLLEAEVTKATTGIPGVKEVKVHNTSNGGEISNSKDFEVKPKPPRA